jgi:galactokinase
VDKPTCATSVEVLKQIMKQANELGDENGTLVARMKDLENENESCMKRVKELEKKNEKHMEIIKCLEKENDIYRAREIFFIYVLLL